MSTATRKLIHETAPGVNHGRYRLSYSQMESKCDGELVVSLDKVDPEPGELPWRKIGLWFLPLDAGEFWDLEAWSAECLERRGRGDAEGVRLSEADFPPIPREIEYEITVRRITPAPGDQP